MDAKKFLSVYTDFMIVSHTLILFEQVMISPNQEYSKDFKNLYLELVKLGDKIFRLIGEKGESESSDLKLTAEEIDKLYKESN